MFLIGGKFYPAEVGRLANVVMVPILGTIAAGVPITAIESLDGYIRFIPAPGIMARTFSLCVSKGIS